MSVIFFRVTQMVETTGGRGLRDDKRGAFLLWWCGYSLLTPRLSTGVISTPEVSKTLKQVYSISPRYGCKRSRRFVPRMSEQDDAAAGEEIPSMHPLRRREDGETGTTGLAVGDHAWFINAEEAW